MSKSFFLLMSAMAVIAASLVSCSSLRRHPESGYSGGAGKSTRYGWSLNQSKDMNSNVPDRTDVTQKIRKLESALNISREIDQYSKALPYFLTPEEKLEFLELGDFDARQSWMNDNKFYARSKTQQSQFQPMIEKQSITNGMSMSLVRQSWGEPELVEVSGNPQFRNEKWRYQKQVSSTDGFKLEKRVVYFEGGLVVGWEIN